MSTALTVAESGSKALALVQTVMSNGLDGQGPFKGAVDLATEYLDDARYVSDDARIDALVNWETTKNFGTGFATGLGGIATLPISIPASVGSAWIIQARMVGAIAHIRGYDVTDDRVRTLVVATLIGDATVKETVKTFGVEFSQKGGKALVGKLSGQTVTAINKKVGFRLMTKAGSRGLINVSKLIPVLGGVVGGTVDAASCRTVAALARRTFTPLPDAV